MRVGAISCLAAILWTSVHARAESAPEKPVALLVAGEGGEIDVPGVASHRPVYPGMVIFPGYVLRAGAAPVRFAFCAIGMMLELRPAGEITFAAGPPSGATIGAALPVCELPLMSRTPRPTTDDDPENRRALEGTLESRLQELEPDPRAQLASKLTAAQAMLASPELKLVADVSRAALFEQSGLIADALAGYRRIRDEWPHATWTSDVITRTASQKLPSRPATVNSMIPRRVIDKTANRPPPGPSQEGGQTYAFLVGISHYQPGNGIDDLHFADHDAESFRGFLKSPRGGALHDEQIWLLRNEEATRERIDQSLHQFVQGKEGKNNTLILFIAAHGRYICLNKAPGATRNLACEPGAPNEEPFILTYESNPQDPHVSAYSMMEFYRKITANAGQFGRVLVYVDVCHAGVVGNLPANTLLSPKPVEDIFATSKGDVGIMMASSRLKPSERDEEYAYESKDFGGGHGIFTYFVLHGLNGGVQPAGQGTIFFEDLFSHVAQQVRAYTGRKQSPNRVVNSNRLTVTGDVREKTGIDIGPITAKDASGQRRRGSGQSKNAPAVPARPAAPIEAGLDPDEVAFEDAVRSGKLLPGNPGNAFDALERLRARLNSGSPARRYYEDRLRVALEEQGQTILLKYLEGDQVPQTKEDFDRGAACFKLALEMAPDAAFDLSRRLFCQGRSLVFDKQYRAAAELLERAIRLDPGRAYAYNALGIAYLEQVSSGVPNSAAFYDRAVRAFDDAVRFAPYWAYPRHNRALAYAERGDYNLAIREYEQAMLLAPHYSYLPYNLGLLYQQLHQLPEAEAMYNRGIEIARNARRAGLRIVDPKRWPEVAELRNALGTLADLRNQGRRAERLYRQALRDDPRSLSASHNLALSLSGSAMVPEAEKLWIANLKQDPEHLPSLLGYAGLLKQQGKYKEATPLYRKALEIKPKFVPASIDLAGALLGAGDAKAAAAVLEEPLRDEPERADLWSMQAEVLQRLGLLDDARRALDLAIRYAGDDVQRKEFQQRRGKLRL